VMFSAGVGMTVLVYVAFVLNILHFTTLYLSVSS
jgi:hypothetical protein